MSKTSHPRVPRTGDELLAQRERSWWRRVIRTACCARRPLARLTRLRRHPATLARSRRSPDPAGHPLARNQQVSVATRPPVTRSQHASGLCPARLRAHRWMPRRPSRAPDIPAVSQQREPAGGARLRANRLPPPARTGRTARVGAGIAERRQIVSAPHRQFHPERFSGKPTIQHAGIRFSPRTPRTPRTDARSAPRRRDRAREQQIGLFGFLPGTARQLVHPPAAHLLLSTSGSHHRLASAFSTQISG